MKSDSKIYRFFFGGRNDTGMPFAAWLLIFVPFFVLDLYLSDRKHSALSANPVFTSTVVSRVYSLKNTPYIDYCIHVNRKMYKGSCSTGGFAVGDSIGVVYQKDNPENNMTVFEYYEGPPVNLTIIIVTIAIALALYRWKQINRKYNDRCPVLERSGACMIYRTDKEYIFVTGYGKYGHNNSYPIKFIPLDCSNGEFEDTLMEIFHASLHGKYMKLKPSELIRAMKQRSWRQLNMRSTSVFVHYGHQDERSLIVNPTKPSPGSSYRHLDWDSERTMSFRLGNASWKEIISSIRKLLEPDETDR